MVFISSYNFRNRIYAQKTRPLVRTTMASLIKFTVSALGLVCFMTILHCAAHKIKKRKLFKLKSSPSFLT